MAKIRGGQIQNDSITGLHIEDKSIEGTDIADETLSGQHFINESIPFTKIDPSYPLPHDRLNISLLAPVDSSTNLPLSANDGDIIVAKDTGVIYVRRDNTWYVGAGGSYSTSDFNNDLATKTTDNLTEGSVNKYFFNHDNSSHSQSYITSTGVNFSNLDANSSVGTGASQVSFGNHDHSGIYEPVFNKNTAFNKNFGSGTDQIAAGNHDHSGIYEQSFSKNTAFNKDFGTIGGTISEGNHNHNSVYLRLDGSGSMTGSLNSPSINITSVHPLDTATIFGSESEGNSILHVRIGNGSTDKISFESWNGTTSSSLLEIGQSDVTILGNLNVTGTTTTIDSTTINISDNEIVLNSNVSGTPILNAGLVVNRGSLSDTSLIWNETSDKWEVNNGGGLSEIISAASGDSRYRAVDSKGTVIEWGNALEYNSNAIVSYQGNFYISLQDANLNKQPDTETTWWAPYSTQGIAFSAYRSSSQTCATGDPFIFNVEYFDTHNAYDHTTGVFTAPIDGLYSFLMPALHATASTVLNARLWVNGVATNQATYAEARGETTGAFLLQLNAGDYVSINSMGSMTLYGNSNSHHSRFMGHLVSGVKGEKGDAGTTTATGTNGNFDVPGTLKIGGNVTLEYNAIDNSLEFIFDV